MIALCHVLNHETLASVGMGMNDDIINTRMRTHTAKSDCYITGNLKEQSQMSRPETLSERAVVTQHLPCFSLFRPFGKL
jgi:hypothetical protein